MEVEISCLFFAKSREITGTSQITVKFPQKPLLGGEILDIICKAFPKLQVLRDTVILSVNQAYIDLDSTVTLNRGDEIAIIPPITKENMTSNDIVKLTADVLSVEEATSLASDASIGATSIFIGTTRDNFEGKKVLQLEYEAYEPQALSEMKKICATIRDKWAVHGIVMFHRTGNVPVGEASVIIAISSRHRKESLEAVEFAINTLKATVPIWKKEVYDDGQAEWKQNKECFWMANMQS